MTERWIYSLDDLFDGDLRATDEAAARLAAKLDVNLIALVTASREREDQP